MHLHLLDTLAARRAERAAHQHLADELAAFTTPADLLEIESVIDRYSDEDTREIREILTARAA
jgi:hypothetical protein